MHPQTEGFFLRRENDRLREELAYFKSEIGIGSDIAPLMLALSTTRTLAIIAKTLLGREMVSRSAMAVILWQDCPRDGRTLDVMVHKLRKALLPFGIMIETMYAYGWRMLPLSKQRLRELLAR